MCAVPGTLIGQSNVHLPATLKLREGKLNVPIATKTRIRYAMCGSLRKPQSNTIHRQLDVWHVRTESTIEDLHKCVSRFFDIEILGVALVPTVKGVEEQRSYSILEAIKSRLNSKKFETGLL